MENSPNTPAQGEPVIKVRGLRHFYREGDEMKEVLHGVNLDIEKGEIVIIMGPSGSGKSTLLKLIGAQLTLQEGDIIIDGHSLMGADKKHLMLLRRNLGFIFQSHHLLNSLKVVQNVQLPLAFDGRSTAKSSKKDALEALATVGIVEQADKFPTHLSGGQRQRVADTQAENRLGGRAHCVARPEERARDSRHHKKDGEGNRSNCRLGNARQPNFGHSRQNHKVG